MVVREANIKDITAIYEIIQTNLTLVNSLDYPEHVIEFMTGYYSESNIESWINEYSMFLVVEEGHEILGCVALDDNEVKGLYVAVGSQRKGVGKKLITELEFRTDEEKLILYASLTAYDFYKVLGYTTVERVNDPDMGEAYLMYKNI